MLVSKAFSSSEKHPLAKGPPLAAKTARDVLAEVTAVVMPLTGGSVTLTEMINDSPNWTLHFTGMGDDKVKLIVDLIGQLVSRYPSIDWSGEVVQLATGRRTLCYLAK